MIGAVLLLGVRSLSQSKNGDIMLKQFEVTCDHSGRLAVRSGCFGPFEFLLIPVVVGDNGYKTQVLCFADNEIE